MSTTNRNALGAQSVGNGLDNLIQLGDSGSNIWTIKANGTSKRLEFIKNGTVTGVGGGVVVSEKAANYTATAADNGKLFAITSAATITLPAIADVADGWTCRVYGAVDGTWAVTAPSGKLICFNNVAATTITFSTSGEKAGTCVEIVYLGTTAKYIAIVSLAAETVTPTIS